MRTIEQPVQTRLAMEVRDLRKVFRKREGLRGKVKEE